MKGFVLLVGLLLLSIDCASAAERWVFRSRARVVTSNRVVSNAQCSGGACYQEQSINCENGQCEVISESASQRPVIAALGKITSRVINRDNAAYQHALKEATYLAERGIVGHPFGVAPGCNKAGTGCSSSESRPNHCFMELPESRIVARAVVRGRDGRFYWSAHYR